MSSAQKLPSVAEAKLPATYESAKKALASCEHIDECQSWADKAAALASYARQADDVELENYAVRIRARAIRRAGELLLSIEPQPGANQNIRAGGDPKVTRKQAAEDAGLSPRQRKQAQRVAGVPVDQFEHMVEGDRPTPVGTIADAGKQTSPFTPEQTAASGFRVGLDHVLEKLDRLNKKYKTPNFNRCNADDAIACDSAAAYLKGIAKCIRAKI